MDWIDPTDMAAIDRSFATSDLVTAIGARAIAHTVVVEAASIVAETEELLAIVAAEPLISGVVGFVDLAAPDVADEIDRLRESPGGDRLVGIRSPVQDEPDPRWLARPDVIAGVRAVAARNLAYDLLILPSQIDAAVETAQAVPEARFVVDHLAKPEIVDRDWETWATAIARLAALPNVTCKRSGMVTQADWQRWTIDDLRPYAEHVLGVFGADRLLFGTDWPVCTLAASYDTVVEVAEQLTADLSDSERDAVFGANATRIYGLWHRDR